ncbi:hypothetical protein ACFSM7_12785 [Clavibacter michiganensis subsp. tessellarius]
MCFFSPNASCGVMRWGGRAAGRALGAAPAYWQESHWSSSMGSMGTT